MIGTEYIPEALRFLNEPYIKIPAFIIIVLIAAYVFEFTKTGRYSRAIGENENAAIFVGIPVSNEDSRFRNFRAARRFGSRFLLSP